MSFLPGGLQINCWISQSLECGNLERHFSGGISPTINAHFCPSSVAPHFELIILAIHSPQPSIRLSSSFSSRAPTLASTASRPSALPRFSASNSLASNRRAFSTTPTVQFKPSPAKMGGSNVVSITTYVGLKLPKFQETPLLTYNVCF